MAEHLHHLVEPELVMARRDRGVGGEDALLGDGVGVFFGGLGERRGV
jgi:hypothetical protein